MNGNEIRPLLIPQEFCGKIKDVEVQLKKAVKRLLTGESLETVFVGPFIDPKENRICVNTTNHTGIAEKNVEYFHMQVFMEVLVGLLFKEGKHLLVGIEKTRGLFHSLLEYDYGFLAALDELPFKWLQDDIRAKTKMIKRLLSVWPTMIQYENLLIQNYNWTETPAYLSICSSNVGRILVMNYGWPRELHMSLMEQYKVDLPKILAPYLPKELRILNA